MVPLTCWSIECGNKFNRWPCLAIQKTTVNTPRCDIPCELLALIVTYSQYAMLSRRSPISFEITSSDSSLMLFSDSNSRSPSLWQHERSNFPQPAQVSQVVWRTSKCQSATKHKALASLVMDCKAKFCPTRSASSCETLHRLEDGMLTFTGADGL
jgi:hypothetical protein